MCGIEGFVTNDFSEVTELVGSQITAEQLQRMYHRYEWAAGFCAGKDVVEVACGSGPGIGILSQASKSLEAGDYSGGILALARAHYGTRVRLMQMDAQSLPFRDASKDVIILFEAIYYVPDAARFVAECKRVLRPGGCVLVATANKDLWDFNPSPMSHRYYGARELTDLLREFGFDSDIYGYMPVSTVSWRQKLLRPAKRLAVGVGMIPGSLKGKRFLKRLVFGQLVTMPAELSIRGEEIVQPIQVSGGEADCLHKVLYCRATLAQPSGGGDRRGSAPQGAGSEDARC
jgi:ubiquinone/menaquinone biosynthesis C-methylase UbiE